MFSKIATIVHKLCKPIFAQKLTEKMNKIVCERSANFLIYLRSMLNFFYFSQLIFSALVRPKRKFANRHDFPLK